jgi:hypothetical protein
MQLLRNFEILDINGEIANNLEILDVIYVKYKKTGSTGIIVRIYERNIFHARYWNTPLVRKFTYIPLIDRNGNPIRIRQSISAPETQFVEIPAKEIKVNSDWLPYAMSQNEVEEFNKKCLMAVKFYNTK